MFGSSLRRLTRTQPAVPAPMMMMSYSEFSVLLAAICKANNSGGPEQSCLVPNAARLRLQQLTGQHHLKVNLEHNNVRAISLSLSGQAL